MMRQFQGDIRIETRGPGLVEFTSGIAGWLADHGAAEGLLTLFCRHTSCSLTIQENADPDVIRDLQDFFAALAPNDPSLYRHTAEGPDDMPAHIKAALTQTHLSIPVQDGQMMLGTWQGIYLFEHRDRPHQRRISLHYLGS